MTKYYLLALVVSGLFFPAALPLKAEKAIEFTGENDSFLEGASTVAYDAEDFSFFAWVRLDEKLDAIADGERYRGNLAGRWNMQSSIFALCFGNDGVWALLYKDDADVTHHRPENLVVRVMNPTPLTPGEWTFVGVVVEGNQTTVHVGEEQRQREFSPAFRRTLGNEFRVQLRVGGGLNVSRNGFKGEITEVSYWKRAVTDEELALIKNRKLTGNEADLLLYYNSQSADGGAETLVKDQSVHHSNGALKKAKWVESTF